jgi:DNA-binding response OmpR family regulator
MFIGVYKHKVLVVDDDPLMASVLGELMCAHGYDVNVMNSAIEAISEIEKEIPSLIISDINMPDMDGYEFCRTIRGRFMDKVIPIILVTGGYSIEERLLGLEAGADDFLIKPFRTKEILLRASALV